MKKFLICLMLVTLCTVLCLSFVGCDEKDPVSATIDQWEKQYTKGDFGIRNKTNPFVEITFSTGDTIRLELYPDAAPISVENFIRYLKADFYKGVVFHRIIDNAIQTGGFEVIDSEITQKEALYPSIKGEFKSNGVTNNVYHRRGTISMARSSDKNSATSQFFICTKATPSWDGEYAAFGSVIDEESMAVVKKISEIETSSQTLYYGENPVSSSDVPNEIVSITKTTLVWENH